MDSKFYSNLNDSERKDLEKLLEETSRHLAYQAGSHQIASRQNCFHQHSENFANFSYCLNDRLTNIQIYKQSFENKLEFELLSFSQCLSTQDPLISPAICLKDLESRCYKNLRDFQNI